MLNLPKKENQHLTVKSGTARKDNKERGKGCDRAGITHNFITVPLAALDAFDIFFAFEGAVRITFIWGFHVVLALSHPFIDIGPLGHVLSLQNSILHENGPTTEVTKYMIFTTFNPALHRLLAR
jgi:hypothetical protein